MEQDISELINKVQEQEELIANQERLLNKLQTQIDEFLEEFKIHRHTGTDGTTMLNTRIKLKPGEEYELDAMTVGSKVGSTDDNTVQRGYIIVGSDTESEDGLENTQFVIEHQPSTTGGANQTFIFGQRAPLYTGDRGTISSGGTTFTTPEYKFDVNELDGAYLLVRDNIDSTVFNMFEIASNTPNTITITGGTWSFSADNTEWFVYTPVYLGSADFPWRRVYTNSGVDGGVRFGTGKTGESQNAHLYFKGSKIIYRYNDAGTTRYKYLDLASTGVTWVATTVAP